MPNPVDRNSAWADADDGEAGALPWRALTAAEAQALRAAQPVLAPWRVVLIQGATGVVIALIAAAVTGRLAALWSALYGAATVALPGAVMARGLASSGPRAAPALGAVRVMAWEIAKLALTVAMLALAPRLLMPLDWPALLIGMVVCLKVYWLALLWRGRSKKL